MTTHYVSPTGDDNNPGTEPLPFRNIQAAAYVVKHGDTVIVKDGIYTDTHSYGVILQIWNGGTELLPVTFRSEHKWGAVLDGLNNTTSTGIIVVADQSYIVIDGFEIKGFRDDGIITYPTTSHITIKNNSIHNIGNYRYNHDEPFGAYASNGMIPGGSYHIVDSNLFYEIGKNEIASHYGNWDHAIYGTGHSHVCTNNIIWDIWTGTALDIGWENSIVSNNIVARFTNIPRVDTPDTYLVSITENATGDKNILIQNNIFYGCVDNPAVIWVGYGDNHSGSQVRNNIKWNGCTNWDEGSWTGLTYSDNMMNTDPKFVNLSERDFHLQSTSLAIGKGTLINAPDHDFDGNPRTGHNDIGAFQYTDTSTCPDLLNKLTITKI